MINKKFEAYKIKREIRRSGCNYNILRKGVNEFGEPISDIQYVGNINALYHEENSNIQITTGDTTQVRTKKIPMLLCIYDDFDEIEFSVGDFVEINSKVFKVTGIVNIQEWGIIGDVSLEVFDDGNKD